MQGIAIGFGGQGDEHAGQRHWVSSTELWGGLAFKRLVWGSKGWFGVQKGGLGFRRVVWGSERVRLKPNSVRGPDQLRSSVFRACARVRACARAGVRSCR
eukprot:357867-Chlamydomonas_euryale.AAC.2